MALRRWFVDLYSFVQIECQKLEEGATLPCLARQRPMAHEAGLIPHSGHHEH
jgi:hypothetical protein